MKELSVLLLGVIGIFLIVHCSNDHEDYKVTSYVQEEVDENDELSVLDSDENSEEEYYDQSEENEGYEDYDSIAYEFRSPATNIKGSSKLAGEYLTIDLNEERKGRCYDSLFDRHRIVGETQLIATSFTDFIQRLLDNKGQHWY